MERKDPASENKKVALAIAGLFVLLSLSLLHVALEHKMWREFFVNELTLAMTGATLLWLLRE